MAVGDSSKEETQPSQFPSLQERPPMQISDNSDLSWWFPSQESSHSEDKWFRVLSHKEWRKRNAEWTDQVENNTVIITDHSSLSPNDSFLPVFIFMVNVWLGWMHSSWFLDYVTLASFGWGPYIYKECWIQIWVETRSSFFLAKFILEINKCLHILIGLKPKQNTHLFSSHTHNLKII